VEKGIPGWTLGDLARRFGGELHGPDTLQLARPVPAGSSDPEGITFAESQKYLDAVMGSGVGAVLLPPSLGEADVPFVRVSSPRQVFAALLAEALRPMSLAPGIHPLAAVDPGAFVDPSARIGAYVVIERGARVGAETQVFPHGYIGEDCQIGARVVLFPRVTLYRDVSIGEGSVVHSGAVLGADGFGFVWDGKRHVKVPQVGSVRIGANVEIGANTSIDRATCGETVIHDGVKIDNLVQIAHNVSVGANTVIAAMGGISGSVTIGERNVLAGNVATVDHVTICDDVVLGGRSAVVSSITEPGEYFGTPALPIGEGLRQLAIMRKLPELQRRLQELEREMASLKEKR